MPDFEPLHPLDLQQCQTVDDLVRSMKYCSFGARMLGEVADTLTQWIQDRNEPLLIYDGKKDTALGKLLWEMVENKKWFKRLLLPEMYAQGMSNGNNILVVGDFSERHESGLYKEQDKSIFINEQGKAKHVQDGYFPDAIFADPRFVLPALYYALEQRLEGKSTTVTQFIRQLEKYDGVAQEVYRGAQTLEAMANDPDCTVFLTLSGAMTVAKMGLIIGDLIDDGVVQSITSTGALMAHGLVESVGLKHYKYDPVHDDAVLAAQKLNRVSDTLEPETNLDKVEEVVELVADSFSGDELISPRIFHYHLGKYLAEHYPQERGILKSAYEKKIPVLVPAFVDSEIGNDIYLINQKRIRELKKRIVMDLEQDTEELIRLVTKAKRIGILTIGGGVPRNYTQNVCPLVELINLRLGLDLPEHKFAYGVRICPDKMWYGHLSGSTYSEGMSWRKMHPQMQFAEIHADATLVLPFLVKMVEERTHR